MILTMMPLITLYQSNIAIITLAVLQSSICANIESLTDCSDANVSITLLYYFVKYTYNLFSSRYLHKGHD